MAESSGFPTRNPLMWRKIEMFGQMFGWQRRRPFRWFVSSSDCWLFTGYGVNAWDAANKTPWQIGWQTASAPWMPLKTLEDNE